MAFNNKHSKNCIISFIFFIFHCIQQETFCCRRPRLSPYSIYEPLSVLYGCPEGPCNCDRQWARLSCDGRHTKEQSVDLV
jgi:hypothetical protein